MSGETLSHHDSTSRVLRTGVTITAVFALVQVAAVIHPVGFVAAISLAWSALLFLAGAVLFVVGFVVGAGRSRDDTVTMAGMIWLVDAAPPDIARRLRLLIVGQVVIACLAAIARPFTVLAFGILVPTFGLGLVVWYAARFGQFQSITSTQSRGPDSPLPDAKRNVTEKHEDPDDFDQLFRRRKRSESDAKSD